MSKERNFICILYFCTREILEEMFSKSCQIVLPLPATLYETIL